MKIHYGVLQGFMVNLKSFDLIFLNHLGIVQIGMTKMNTRKNIIGVVP
jgi:hypothetical protein